jgi:predicted lipoprotein with Yx(FWY)xxD motif
MKLNQSNSDLRAKRFNRFSWVGVILLAALALAACAPAATPAPTATAMPPAPTATTAPTATSAPAAVKEPTIMMATDPKLGKILVDDKGMTLYIFTKDVADKSNCSGDCLTSWPPLLTSGSPKAGDGVDASMLGSTALPDGSKIVTYNHMPLYYWVKDTKPGDTTGQNVGKVWFVIDPTGMVIKPAAATPTAAAASSTSSDEATLQVVTDPKLGKILADGKGMTLYMFKKDTAGKSNCTGGCLTAWPPLLTKGKPVIGDGIDATQVGSAALADGSMVVTYKGLPLYYYAKDAKPGDTTGQGVGSVWYIVNP